MKPGSIVLAVVLVICGLAVVGCSKDKDVKPPPKQPVQHAPTAGEKTD